MEHRAITFRGKEAIIVEGFKDSIPEGYHFYGIRHSDNDWDLPITIENLVIVNRWGFIGFREELPKEFFDFDGCLWLTEEEQDLLLERG